MKSRWIWIFTIVVCSSIYSQEGLFFGVAMDYHSGIFHELVYYNSSNNSPLMSELIWEVENLVTTTAAMEYKQSKWGIAAAVSLPISRGTGQMEDYDWLGLFSEYSSLNLGTGPDEWTNYSLSDLSIEKYLHLSMHLNAVLLENSSYSLRIEAKYDTLHIRWEDTPLFYIYSNSYDPNGWKADRGDFTADNAINYEWHENSIFLGFSNHYRLPLKMELYWKILYSIWNDRYTVDEHLLRPQPLQFNDWFPNAERMQLEIGLLSPQWGIWQLEGLFAVDSFSRTRGDTETLYFLSQFPAGQSMNGAGSFGYDIRVSLMLKAMLF